MNTDYPDLSSFANSRSHAVALIVSDITNPFFTEIIPAIEERLGVEGFVVFVGNTSEDLQKEERLLAKIREFPPDGVLICPALGDVESSGRAPHLAGRLPIVAFARRAPGLDYAGVDNAQGAQLAVDHLYQLGYQRIAFIGGNPNSSAGQERVEGYQRALTRSGLPFDPLLVIPSAPTRRGGYDSTQRLLQIEDRPTAALCFNDVVAFGVIEAIQLAGLKVGAGFGVIGFNDISADTEPALTTIDTAPRQLGETAAELLLRRIKKPDSLIQTTILHPRLIVRESCGTIS
jgi:LacI family transcriptional regulator, galactose operon repressor